MSYILLLETSTEICSVALAENDQILFCDQATIPNDHAAQLTLLIQKVLFVGKIQIHKLDAICVSCGPGSYTGLRIGLSTAKGICYALNKPIIFVSTLLSMTFGAKEKYSNVQLFCPMLDAKRMEVYCAVYDHLFLEIIKQEPKIIEQNIFDVLLQKNNILFFGTGMHKLKEILTHPHSIFLEDFQQSASHLILPAWQKYKNNQFENLAYCEPHYLKNFYTPSIINH